MHKKTSAQLDQEIAEVLATRGQSPWTVAYKMEKGPLIKTDIKATTSDAAWKAFTAYRIEHGIDDYHTAQVFQESE